MSDSPPSRRFAIAVSFPGEHRKFVRNVVDRLAEILGRDRVFYDEWYQAELLGLDGDLKLRRYYRELSELVIPFFSEHYRKDWCQIEWSAIRSMLKHRRAEDAVIPVEMDGTRIEGWEDIDFGIRKGKLSGKRIADLIIDAYRLRYPEAESSSRSIPITPSRDTAHDSVADRLHQASGDCSSASDRETSAFSLLDRYPAKPEGHVGFLEMVRDEVHSAADAKREQLARGYSNQTLESMIRGIKWIEAQSRLSALSGFPDEAIATTRNVLNRELTIGTVLQVDALLSPSIINLRDALEQLRLAGNRNGGLVPVHDKGLSRSSLLGKIGAPPSVLLRSLTATENAMLSAIGHEPVVVLITVNDHETDALLDVFLGPKQTPVPASRGGVTYHELGLHGGLRVIHSLCEMGAGGIGAAQQRAQDAITHWQPRAVIAVGIAFGIDESKQQIGDVLVSVQLQDYELARVKADGTLTPRGDKPHASDTLVNRFRQTDVRCRRGEDNWPKVRFGLVLSGQKLVDNLDYRENLKRLWSEAIGGEMEGTGLCVSAQRAGADWLVVKAICDWGYNKNQADKDAWQKTAAANAARVVKAALDAGDLYKSTSAASPHTFNPPGQYTAAETRPLVTDPASDASTRIPLQRTQILRICGNETPMSPASQPSILISGSKKHIPSHLGAKLFGDFCRALGKRLANTKLTIVVGSTHESTADRQFLEGANQVEAVRNLRVITRTEEVHDGPTFAELQRDLPNVDLSRITHWNEEWPALRRRQVDSATLVLLVGGSVGTLHIAETAKEQGKLVIPIAAAGGSAEKTFDWFSPSLRQCGVTDAELDVLRNAYDPELVIALIERLLETLVREIP